MKSRKNRKRRVRVAIAQFPVNANPRVNGRAIRRLMRKARAQRADILQTCEAALCGYNESRNGWSASDWKTLREETTAIRNLARELNLWVALGSAHYLNRKENPTNCLYLINSNGKVVDRYDKCFCTGRIGKGGDLKVYTSGDHRVVFALNGFKFGLQICYDICFPHLYQAYEGDGVEIMLHSFYNGAAGKRNCLAEIGPAWCRVRAADHEMWVCATNTSKPYAQWAGMICAPDGTAVARLPLHRTGILVYEITGMQPPPNGWLHMAHNRPLYWKGILHNGRPSASRRARDRRSVPAGPNDWNLETC